MKKFYLLIFLAIVNLIAKSQFSSMPLNFPGNNYRTDYNSVVDSNTLWVGTILNPPYVSSYSNAIRTTDGGDTWQFFTIPETGNQKVINNVCALDSNTCFYIMWNGSGGSVWKTTDGGSSWNKKTTTQFSGGYPNFYHAFSADTGISVGDPNGGYWEIYHTYDGGNSWTRVPTENIPPCEAGEAGVSSSYSSIGDYIWFSTTNGRCYRSTDRGLHWTVTFVSMIGGGYLYNVCFIDTVRGIFWEAYPTYKKGSASYPYNIYYITVDGGIAWEERQLELNYNARGFCRVPGINGGVVITTSDLNYSGELTVLFSPDFLTSIFEVQTNITSSGFPLFLDKTLGWLSGPGLQNGNIYKFEGDLMSFVGVDETNNYSNQVKVIPNPSGSKAYLKIPASFIERNLKMRIFSPDGSLLNEISHVTKGQFLQIDGSQYADGIYYIQLLMDEGSSFMSKWIISR